MIKQSSEMVGRKVSVPGTPFEGTISGLGEHGVMIKFNDGEDRYFSWSETYDYNLELEPEEKMTVCMNLKEYSLSELIDIYGGDTTFGELLELFKDNITTMSIH